MPVDANIATSLPLVVRVATKLVIMKTNKTDSEIIILLLKN